jgi:tetratricopeptide (TPR) repeat protein
MSSPDQGSAARSFPVQALPEEGFAVPIPRPADSLDPSGDSASPEAMARLGRAVDTLKRNAVREGLARCMAAMAESDWITGADRAIEALRLDERNGFGWWLLAICREKAGDLRNAILSYESALTLLPDHGEVANDLGRLAHQLGQLDVAARLFAHFLLRRPNHPEGANNLACTLNDLGRYEEATDLLRTALADHPGEPLLWNTLGTVMAHRGDSEKAAIFFREALRLEPRFARARYNLANAVLALGDASAALADVDAALELDPSPSDAAMMRLARSSMLLAGGDLARGWEAYEIRLDPDYAGATLFQIDRPLWTPETDVFGKSILVVGEQGLGDEILFANVLPDLIEALGPAGRLTLAVEIRQVALFQRSFPQAKVGHHATATLVGGKPVRLVPFVEDLDAIDLWTPIASLLRRWRRSVDAFPDRPAFLTPDPARVAAWRARLAELGPEPKVGILWKSLKQDASRRRWFSAFEQWRPILETPGVRFVNLQYGDCSAELDQARAAGFDIWDPPGIDLKLELDEVAALSCALDLVIGPANATSNIAAACGAPVWLISAPGAWPRLGTERYPWYPRVRVFLPEALNIWEPVMAEIAQALAAAF